MGQSPPEIEKYPLEPDYFDFVRRNLDSDAWTDDQIDYVERTFVNGQEDDSW